MGLVGVVLGGQRQDTLSLLLQKQQNKLSFATGGMGLVLQVALWCDSVASAACG
jgi:hypothetical protein